MSDTTLRQLAMLRLIPRYPQKITSRQLRERLAGDGFEVTDRTIQRDLNKLAGPLFALQCDDRDVEYGWCWMRDAAVLDIPAMSPQTALAFKLAELFLQPLMPRSTLRHLGPHFQAAGRMLDQTGNELSAWPDKVRVVPRNLRLLDPEIPEHVTDTVYQALLEERKLDVTYNPRREEGQRDYEVNPLGLVVRDNVSYLVCTLWHYTDVLQLALHRIVEAELSDESARRPEGFDLDTYIREQRFDYPVGDTIALDAWFTDDAAYHLHETPLSEDQTLEPDGNGWTRVRATVGDTQQLRWWLLGFGDNINVQGPPQLREEMTRTAQRMAERYRCQPNTTGKHP